VNTSRWTYGSARTCLAVSRLTFACAFDCLTSVPGQCGEPRHVRIVKDTVRKVVPLQGDDGSWGRFPRASPDVERELMIETTALTSLAVSTASDDKEEVRAVTALSKSSSYLLTACRSLERRQELTEVEERIFALAVLSLLELRHGRQIDHLKDDEMSRFEQRIGEIVLRRIQGELPGSTIAWHCLVLESASRDGSPTASAAMESVKGRINASSPPFSGDRPWAFLVRALLGSDRRRLIGEVAANLQRDNWVATFDEAVFCSIAIDRISCFHELRDRNKKTPLIAINSEGKPLTDRPGWMKWQDAIEKLATGEAQPLMQRERVRDVSRGVSTEWSDLRTQVKQCLLRELYFRRMLINAPPEE